MNPLFIGIPAYGRAKVAERIIGDTDNRVLQERAGEMQKTKQGGKQE